MACIRNTEEPDLTFDGIILGVEADLEIDGIEMTLPGDREFGDDEDLFEEDD